MKKLLFIHIVTFTLTLMSCTQPENKSTSGSVNSVDSIEVSDTILNLNDTVLIDINQFSISDLDKLKKLVSNEYEKVDYFKNKSVDSLTITNSDSISKFGYIASMFPIDKIDSIEFYGIFYKNKVSPRYLTMNSLLILYFNDKNISQQELDSMEINYRKNFRATESMFKPGGTSFVIDNQLAVYSVNTCGPGYRNLQRIDTLITNDVFNGNDFVRLHAGCGMGPFKRIEK